MGKSGRQALVLLSVLIIGSVCNTNVAVTAAPWSKVHAIFGFGDSLIDPGNNNFIEGSDTRADFQPYGQTFFQTATGRFTDGRLVFDFIASRLGLPFMPPFLKPGIGYRQGVNFGSAGSGILSTTGLRNGVNSLATQISQFQEVVLPKLTRDQGEKLAIDLVSNSLFFIVTGNNDLFAYLSNSTLQQTVSPTGFVTSVLSELEGYTQTVFSLGARKVVFVGIGPLGCAPRTMAATNGSNGNCVATPNELAQAYNGGLLQLVEGLNSKLPNLHAVMVNPFDAIEGLIHDGTAKGFTEGSNACCGSGPFNGAVRCGPDHTTNLCENVENFVFWDYVHPTERVNRQIARLMWVGNSSTVQPINLKTLVQL